MEIFVSNQISIRTIAELILAKKLHARQSTACKPLLLPGVIIAVLIGKPWCSTSILAIDMESIITLVLYRTLR